MVFADLSQIMNFFAKNYLCRTVNIYRSCITLQQIQ